MKLAGSVAVVTGGNSGIGLAIGREFKSEGARVVIFGRNPQTLQEAAHDIGEGTLAVQGDVSIRADLDRLYQMTAERFGKIQVLIANAGIAKFSPIEEFTEALFDELCDVQFKGTFLTVQRALPFLKDSASIVLVSAATATSRGTPLMSVLTAAKAAVRSLARTFSAELLPRGIRVNVLSPGLIDTPLLTRDIGLPAGGGDEIARSALGQIPMKRLGTAQEIAKAALFLACSDSSYCLGAELVVDGGLCQI